MSGANEGGASAPPFTDEQARERFLALMPDRRWPGGILKDTAWTVGRALLELEAERDEVRAEIKRRNEIQDRVRRQRPHTLGDDALVQWYEVQVEEAVEYAEHESELHAASAKREEALEAQVKALTEERDVARRERDEARAALVGFVQEGK